MYFVRLPTYYRQIADITKSPNTVKRFSRALSSKRSSKMAENYVVYDADAGTDDAWGLLMLIRGEEAFKNYKILGVTCVQGNTDVENVTRNTLRVLESVNRTDIPLFKGCAKSMLPTPWQRKGCFHGKDGFGDILPKDDVDMSKVQKKHAVNAMYEFACQHPKKVDYILVGPLTNFAMCINMYGDDFLDKVRNIHVMGGNYRGKGNVTKSAEFNFMLDPEAAFIVLEHVKIPLVILPWETCIDGDYGLSLDWRFNVPGGVASRAMDLMNSVERAILIPKGYQIWISCDALLVAAFMFPQHCITKSRLYHATVEITGTHTRGQMVLDHLRENKENIVVITEIHKEHFKKIIEWTAGVEGIVDPVPRA